jgi:Ca-activated chloride channel family protein
VFNRFRIYRETLSRFRAPLQLSALASLLVIVTTATAQNPTPAPATTTQQRVEGRADERIRLDTDIVTLTVTVTDPYNRLVTGLDRQHFEIFEDKVKQSIEFFSDDDVPVEPRNRLRCLGSMKGKIDRARDSLRAFIETSHREDDFFLVGFNQRANLISEFSGWRHSRQQADAGRCPWSDRLYDASYLGIEKVKQGRHSKRAAAHL